MKPIFYLVVVNIAIMLMLGIFVNILGLNPVLQKNGLNLGMLFAFSAIFGFGGSFISLYMSKWMAKKSMGVQLIDNPKNSDEIFIKHTVEKMSEKLGIKTPEIGIFYNDTPNAFATGATKNSALVAVSSGLLNNMSKNEVEAVIGHEMTHIVSGDMVTSTLLQGVLNTFVIFISRIVADIISRNNDGKQSFGTYMMVSMVMQMVLGFFASLIIFWHSRHREYHADRGGADLSSNQNMISALQALERLQQQGKTKALPDQLAAFGFSSFGGLFLTHPPLEKRINALRNKTIV